MVVWARGAVAVGVSAIHHLVIILASAGVSALEVRLIPAVCVDVVRLVVAPGAGGLADILVAADPVYLSGAGGLALPAIGGLDEPVVAWAVVCVAVGLAALDDLVVCTRTCAGAGALEVRVAVDNVGVLSVVVVGTRRGADPLAVLYLVDVVSVAAGASALKVQLALDRRCVFPIERCRARRHADILSAVLLVDLAAAGGLAHLAVGSRDEPTVIWAVVVIAVRLASLDNHVVALADAGGRALEVRMPVVGVNLALLVIVVGASRSADFLLVLLSVYPGRACRLALLAARCLDEYVAIRTVFVIAVGFAVFGDPVVCARMGAGCRALKVRVAADDICVLLVVVSGTGCSADHLVCCVHPVDLATAAVSALEVRLAGNYGGVFQVELTARCDAEVLAALHLISLAVTSLFALVAVIATDECVLARTRIVVAVGVLAFDNSVVVAVGTLVSTFEVRLTADHVRVLLVVVVCAGCGANFIVALYRVSLAGTAASALMLVVATDERVLAWTLRRVAVCLIVFGYSVVRARLGAGRSALEICVATDNRSVFLIIAVSASLGADHPILRVHLVGPGVAGTRAPEVRLTRDYGRVLLVELVA